MHTTTDQEKSLTDTVK